MRGVPRGLQARQRSRNIASLPFDGPGGGDTQCSDRHAHAAWHGVALLPFLLEPIATDRNAFQADNLHPVASAQPKLRDHVWPALVPLLK